MDPLDPMNCRGPIPPKETPAQRKRRRRMEREQADAFIRFRMDVIAETYSVHLKDLYLTAAHKVFLQHGSNLLEDQRRREKAARMTIHGDNYVQVDSHGEVDMSSTDDHRPERFYMTTKHAAWRVYRHHHDKSGDQPRPTSYRRVSFLRPPKSEEVSPYKDYVHKISEMMTRMSATQGILGGASKAGSFMMLTPFEKYTFRGKIHEEMISGPPQMKFKTRKIDPVAVKRVTEMLKDKKLEERKGEGGMVRMKGRGNSGRSSRNSQTSHQSSKPSSASKTSRTADFSDSESQDRSRGESPSTAKSENDTISSPPTSAAYDTPSENE